MNVHEDISTTMSQTYQQFMNIKQKEITRDSVRISDHALALILSPICIRFLLSISFDREDILK